MRAAVFCLISTLAGMHLANAHHAAAPHYDLDKTITVTGTITGLRIVNPHGFIYFDAVDEKGEIAQWRCSLTSATRLRARGWTRDTLKPGQVVVLTGWPARREPNHCLFDSLVLDDGTEVSRDSATTKPPGTGNGPNPQPDANQALAGRTQGHPDLSGNWQVKPSGGFPGARRTPGSDPRAAYKREEATAPKATEAGALAAANYDPVFDDPALSCHPANIIYGWSADKMVNAIDHDDRSITVTYGYMDLVRTIHLDQSVAVAGISPSVAGHSIGRWDGDELVVETRGFRPGVLLRGAGRMHSEDMVVTERLSLSEDGQTLTVSYTAHDPAFLQSDYVGETVLLRTSEPYIRYACIDLEGGNNERAQGQDGNN